MLETINKFAESVAGRTMMAAIAFICMLLIAGILVRRKQFSAKMMAYAAVCVALATVLSYIKVDYAFAYGGSVTACSMFFIALVGFWFGPAAGLLAGITQGLIQFTIDPYIIHPVQMFLDYPIAFGLLGLSGFFANKKYGLQIGYIVGCLGRLTASTISGVIFFAEYAPEGTHPLAYSVAYNGTYIGIEAVITIALISVPVFYGAVKMVKKQATT